MRVTRRCVERGTPRITLEERTSARLAMREHGFVAAVLGARREAVKQWQDAQRVWPRQRDLYIATQPLTLARRAISAHRNLNTCAARIAQRIFIVVTNAT